MIMISFLDSDFTELNDFVEKQNPSKIFVLVDENTHEFCAPTLLQNLQTTAPLEIIEIEAGEELKTIETAVHLWEILAEFSADRKSLLINLGGGVISDLGGFVASTYKRGIPFINLPTTLLSMCDASIGGKTGIDHLFLKNIIGTFAQPKAIFVFPDFLTTLPFIELRSGFAEMLKHGLVADALHWQDLKTIENLSSENIAPFILKSMEIKESIVAQDFEEQNIRKILNFGHTIGHAFESLLLSKSAPITHGEAVAAGMICETKIAQNKKMLTADAAEKIINTIMRFFPLLEVSDFSNEELLFYMLNDKKNTGDTLNFSLISGIGNCSFDVKTTPEEVFEALSFYQKLQQ